MGLETSAQCCLLEWDSSFFGFPIARVLNNTLSKTSSRAVLEWSHANSVRCLYFLADPGSTETADLAHNLGFKFVDVRVQLCAGVNGLGRHKIHDIELRTVRTIDVAALEAIARKAHNDSRFFFDTNFPRARAEDLFARWVATDCQGRADRVLTAEYRKGGPLGYITCNLSKDSNAGRIGLVGVSAEFRGKGVGKMLISGALDWFRSVGAEKVLVVTQLRNIAAQRLYQAAGFRIDNIGVWYHRWF